jgi:hypothetical protein
MSHSEHEETTCRAGGRGEEFDVGERAFLSPMLHAESATICVKGEYTVGCVRQ